MQTRNIKKTASPLTLALALIGGMVFLAPNAVRAESCGGPVNPQLVKRVCSKKECCIYERVRYCDERVSRFRFTPWRKSFCYSWR